MPGRWILSSGEPCGRQITAVEEPSLPHAETKHHPPPHIACLLTFPRFYALVTYCRDHTFLRLAFLSNPTTSSHVHISNPLGAEGQLSLFADTTCLPWIPTSAMLIRLRVLA